MILEDDFWENCAFRCLQNLTTETMVEVTSQFLGRSRNHTPIRKSRSVTAVAYLPQDKKARTVVEPAEDWRLHVDDWSIILRQHWPFLVIVLAILRLRSDGLRNGLIVLAIDYAITNRQDFACEQSLHFDTIGGDSEQEIWMTLDENTCKRVGIESAKRPLHIKRDHLEVDHGVRLST